LLVYIGVGISAQHVGFNSSLAYGIDCYAVFGNCVVTIGYEINNTFSATFHPIKAIKVFVGR